jgi:mRNA-degrading endonuclease YafQ of YafQ-DinJ toxin-antitoxin module
MIGSPFIGKSYNAVMSDQIPKFLPKASDLLEISYKLATGPNKYKSDFGKILESVFRKGYFTLQTLVILAEKAKEIPDLKIVVGGSMLDLSRRVFEDMIYMEYIAEKDKNAYTKQFFQYIAVDQKNDMEFLISNQVAVSQETQNLTNTEFEKVPKKLKSRHNWAGMSVEQVIEWLTKNGKLDDKQKETVLKVYIAANRKNHTSPGDILDHFMQESIAVSSTHDIEMGLMVTHGALLKIALRLVEETHTPEQTIEKLQESWRNINNF